MALEICAGSIQSAINAQLGGADRVELCDNLFEGGTTPSPGMIKQAVKKLHIGVFPIIRPRGNDFLYSSDELEIIFDDIHFCKTVGANGVVVGFLKEDGNPDETLLKEVVKFKSPSFKIVHHRAFDVCKNPMEALELFCSLGIDRLLTSGYAKDALSGAENLGNYQKHFGKNIEIMAGGGVTEETLPEIARISGVRSFHGSVRKAIDSGMQFRKTDVPMGKPELGDEFTIHQTDIERVKTLVSLLGQIGH